MISTSPLTKFRVGQRVRVECPGYLSCWARVAEEPVYTHALTYGIRREPDGKRYGCHPMFMTTSVTEQIIAATKEDHATV